MKHSFIGKIRQILKRRFFSFFEVTRHDDTSHVAHNMVTPGWHDKGHEGDTWHDESHVSSPKERAKSKWGRKSVENNKEKKRKRERKRGKGERNRERKEDSKASSSDFRCFDGRSSSCQELKSVYAMRATLQEVGSLPTLVYFHPQGYLVAFSTRRGCLGQIFFL